MFPKEGRGAPWPTRLCDPDEFIDEDEDEFIEDEDDEEISSLETAELERFDSDDCEGLQDASNIPAKERNNRWDNFLIAITLSFFLIVG